MADQAIPTCDGSGDGQRCFWKFPNLPYDISERVRSLYDYYMRLDPATGKVRENVWAVYPNNSTPASLAVLLAYLRRITDATHARLVEEREKIILLAGEAAIPVLLQNLWTDHQRWLERLAFYEQKVTALRAIDPNTPVGSGTQVAQQLGHYVAEPLLLGWYPNEVEPFSQQPSPYSGQVGQSTLDLYTPMTIANQMAVTKAAWEDNWNLFKKDLRDNAGQVFQEFPAAFAALPWIAAIGIGIGIAILISKD